MNKYGFNSSELDESSVESNPAIFDSDNGDLPGDFAIWIFIFAEMLAFGVLFVAYAFDRSNNIELYNASQQTLSRTSGLINTLVLITSSYAVVQAIDAIKQNLSKHSVYWLVFACLLGCTFVGIKLIEFMEKADAGITLSTNSFYMFYLALTFFAFYACAYGDFYTCCNSY